MKTVNIQGWDINLDAFAGIKSIGELKKTPLFTDLGEKERAAAFDELWKALQPAAATTATTPAEEEAADEGQ